MTANCRWRTQSALQEVSFFDVEILIHDGAGQHSRHDLESEDAALAKAAEEQVAALRDFESGGVAVHVVLRLRSGGGERVQIGLRHGGEEDQVARSEVHSVFDYIGNRGGLGK